MWRPMSFLMKDESFCLSFQCLWYLASGQGPFWRRGWPCRQEMNLRRRSIYLEIFSWLLEDFLLVLFCFLFYCFVFIFHLICFNFNFNFIFCFDYKLCNLAMWELWCNWFMNWSKFYPSLMRNFCMLLLIEIYELIMCLLLGIFVC